MRRDNGYFEAFINSRTRRTTAAERSDTDTLSQLVRARFQGSQLRRAGSMERATGVVGSDLDLWLETVSPVTAAERRGLATEIQAALGRPTLVRSHVIRVKPAGEHARIDLSFCNAVFGSRPLPDATPFKDRRDRQMAAKAFKLWTRSAPLPAVPGWAAETLVLGLDRQSRQMLPLELFLKVLGWLADRAAPKDVEALLRPGAHPTWRPEWSAKLPGQLEAIRNAAGRLLRIGPGPERKPFESQEDVGRWLGVP